MIRNERQVFDHLFNEHKVKKYKQKLKTEEESGPGIRKGEKKLSKNDFEQFLNTEVLY